MKNIAVIMVFAGLSIAPLAQAELTHSGYCSEFEISNGCEQLYREGYGEVCSCPGTPAPPPPPFTGTKCSPLNHMTGDQWCCSYKNGVEQDCWLK